MLADLGREKQREWCLYMENYIRKIYLVASGLESLADLSPQEEAAVRGFAAKFKPGFYEKAFAAFSAFASRFPYLCLTSFGLPVEPDVVRSMDRLSCSGYG